MPLTLFITIDTEEDDWGKYATSGQTVENIERIPIIQDLFDRYEAIPTYLVTYPVVKDEHARSILQDFHDSGRCEIATHCHPWNTPPFEEEINDEDSMLSNLPYEIMSRKVETLHEAIVDNFGVNPVSFRAGRFGFGPEVARCIRELSYKIDTSVTPFWNWKESGGPDFLNADLSPYRFDPNDVFLKKGNGSLLEVPVTVGFLQNNLRLCIDIVKWISSGPLSRFRILGLLDRLKILNRRSLSPEMSSTYEMIRLTRGLIQQGYTELNMVFHSSTLLPGRTPFVRSERELKKFVDKIEAYLQFAQNLNMSFQPLRKALEIANGTK